MIKKESIAPGGCYRHPWDNPEEEWLSKLLQLPIKIKFKKTNPNAVLPKKNHDSDTGFDVFAVEDKRIPAQGSEEVDTGLQVAFIEPEYWYQITPRSGLGFKHSIQPHLGVIDSDYRGHLGVKLYNFSNKPYDVKKGDKIAQLVIYPVIKAQAEWSEDVEETERGSKGFGSSGK